MIQKEIIIFIMPISSITVEKVHFGAMENKQEIEPCSSESVGGDVSHTSASISACLFSSSLATTMALCLPERLQHTAHSQSKVTTASSSGDIWTESGVMRQYG